MKRALPWIACFLLIQSILCADALALQPSTQAARPTTAMSKAVERLGSGRDALVVVRLRDKSVVAGYIGESGLSSFTIADPQTGVMQSIPYAQVDRLAGYNPATGVQVQQGGGVRAKLARVFSYVLPAPRVSANHLTGSSKLLLFGIVIGVLIAIVVAKTA